MTQTHTPKNENKIDKQSQTFFYSKTSARVEQSDQRNDYNAFQGDYSYQEKKVKVETINYVRK